MMLSGAQCCPVWRVLLRPAGRRVVLLGTKSILHHARQPMAYGASRYVKLLRINYFDGGSRFYRAAFYHASEYAFMRHDALAHGVVDGAM